MSVVKQVLSQARRAYEVAFVPSGNISATNMQDALEELDTERVTISTAFTTGTLIKATAADAVASSGVTVDDTDNMAGVTTITLDGTLSPAQITANQNDYNPASLADASLLRLTTDASRDITGLAAQSGGRVIVLANSGSNDVRLMNLSGSSSAANQFALGGGNMTLKAQTSVGLFYDGTSALWRPLGHAVSPRLSEIQALATTDGNFIVADGSNWVAESGATARTSLGVTIGTNVQAWDDDLDDIAALTPTDSNIIVGNGTDWVAESGATARTSLGVGTGDTPSFTGIDILVDGTAIGADGSITFGAGSDGSIYSDGTNLLIDAAAQIHFEIGGVLTGGFTNTALFPVGSGQQDLGIATSNEWDDLFFSSGSVINFDNANVTVTHSAGSLAFSGAITLGTDLAVAEGGTGSSTASGARTNLGAGGVAGDTWTGVHDFGGATSFEIPNGAAPTVDAAGEIAIDTTITDHTALLKYFGAEELVVPAMPIASLTANDRHAVLYNATDNEFTMGPTSSQGPINLALAASVGSNALTIAIKADDGTDPSATNPVRIPFRNSTLATGTPNWQTLTGATSLTVSSGSTLGAGSGVAFRLWIVAFDDGGTVRVGVIKARNGTTSVFAFSPRDLTSATAEGGAGGADSSGVFYASAAVTTKAFTVLGSMTWASGLTTAGTWDAVPTQIQLFEPNMLLPGTVIQENAVHATTGASTTTTIPFDTSVPQITEGAATGLSLSFTPIDPSNVLVVESNCSLSRDGAGAVSIAVFDGASSAIVASSTSVSAANFTVNVVGKFVGNSHSGAKTYTVRFGPTAGTAYFNRNAGVDNIYGAAGLNTLHIREIVS